MKNLLALITVVFLGLVSNTQAQDLQLQSFKAKEIFEDGAHHGTRYELIIDSDIDCNVTSYDDGYIIINGYDSRNEHLIVQLIVIREHQKIDETKTTVKTMPNGNYFEEGVGYDIFGEQCAQHMNTLLPEEVKWEFGGMWGIK
jgi:hypothetical protein